MDRTSTRSIRVAGSLMRRCDFAFGSRIEGALDHVLSSNCGELLLVA
jgi:hypothetical protein